MAVEGMGWVHRARYLEPCYTEDWYNDHGTYMQTHWYNEEGYTKTMGLTVCKTTKYMRFVAAAACSELELGSACNSNSEMRYGHVIEGCSPVSRR